VSAAKSPWLASLLSALVPGLGHLYAGDRERGRVLVAIDAALIAALAVAALFFRTGVLKAWASLDSLALIMVGNLVLLAFRAWAAHDAFGLVRGRTTEGGMAWLATAAVALIVLVPHVALGYLTVVQYSLVSTVFADPTPTTVPTASGTTIPGSPTTTTPAGPAIWDGLDRLNLLLLGSDVGPDRRGIRTDTMIVVSVDPETGDAVMVSLPRNMSGVPLPSDVGPTNDCDCFPQLLNDLWWVAEQNPGAFPGGDPAGPHALKTAIGHLLGVDVHYYAMVSLQGFVGIVDALGGVRIDVPNRIVDETYPHEDGVTIEHVVIEPGPQNLDGHLALAYARIRRHADDYARMNRQRCVLGAVIAQSSPVELLARYGSIASVLSEHLDTDIPRDRLVDFIDILPKIDTERIGVLAVNRDYVTHTADRRTYYDHDRIRSEAQALIADPTSGDGPGLELGEVCD
jgi:polyisoprenyl-teichoic acid--peptidoglycan teichoic acid transferase